MSPLARSAPLASPQIAFQCPASRPARSTLWREGKTLTTTERLEAILDYCNHNGLQRLGLAAHYEVASSGVDRITLEILDQFEAVLAAHSELHGE